MANHLTPEELADQLDMERQEVIERCVEMDVPIFHGRVVLASAALLSRLGAGPGSSPEIQH